MKYSAIPMRPRLVRQEAAAGYLSSPALLQLFRQSKWGKPTVERNRMTLWDLNVLDQCVDQLNREGFEVIELTAKSNEQ